uniref:SET domain-containing protein n=1 Tax=Salvator merianae TaxID=96440 RepID=A0A8D0BPX7_SALMN
MGWGVRTMQDLPLGAFVCQYFGEQISGAEAAQREEDTYYFVVDAQVNWVDEWCLDGRFYGNIGRFLNHSCQPNLTAVQVATGHAVPGVAFFTTRDVQAGEELGFDYGDRFWEVKGRRRRWVCQCASPRCRYASPSPTAAAGEPGGPAPLRGFALKSKRSTPLLRKALRPGRPGRPRDAYRP